MDLTVGLDFGTSNSAVGVAVNGQPWLVELEPGEKTLPTAVFFDPKGGMRLGSAANRALIDGEEGRYMRALKSVLGTPLLRETRPIGGKRQSLLDVIALFLRDLRLRTEDQLRNPVTGVVSGRPVHFHSRDAAMDAQAERDLREAYTMAGFSDIRFLPEPEAAALSARDLAAGEIGLVVDIGGGTSDFTLFRKANGRAEVLASHGIRLGGTHFDRALSLRHAMPLLGAGTEVRRALAEGRLPVPASLFNDLASWQKIPFLYTRDTLSLARDLARHAVEPQKLARLIEVLEAELGHDIAFAVEAAKIVANGGNEAAVNLSLVEKGLSAPLTPADLAACLAGNRAELSEAIRDTLALAGLSPEAIGAVVYVGGSSLMDVVARATEEVLPQARALRGDAFTAVIDGLALASSEAREGV
ncbi:MAG: Hsp70 family protein [Alphaproteobacteria bacterium]|nr:Hsp70 family protein [Alphaproteobacteria bacterium]MBU1278805.1 Hsp70 family protein [Alphaproteobacteria bacterium]MBU1575298.1 Hsp70 family protein [Alphaproteobacteria bacterium]MBU1829237.1 Hsp70 family protein [Alphaproteobacteria bacterium]MBU2077947.1 Hsp70 family protein [Alphaproteobacteria bacterium]